MAAVITKKQQDEIEQLVKNGIKTLLEDLEQNPKYNTCASYVPNNALYPSQQMPFVDKHILYLVNHPKTDRHSYISNLKLMLRSE